MRRRHRRRRKSSCSSADLLFDEGRYVEAFDAYEPRAEDAADSAHVGEAPLGRRSRRRCGSPSSTSRGTRPRRSRGPSRADADAMSLYGDALWSSGLFDEAEQKYQDALAIEPNCRAALHGLARSAARAQPARRGDGSRRRRRCGSRRATSRSTTRSARSTSGCTSTRRRPPRTATTSTCCRTRTRATRPRGRAPRSGSSGRSAQRVPFEMDRAPTSRLYTVPFRLVNEKVVVSAKVNDASPQDFVVDTGSENTVISRQTAPAPGHRADHLHAERRRRRGRPARPAAGAHRLARDRHAQAAQRAVPHQEPAAARHPGARNRRASRRWRSASR